MKLTAPWKPSTETPVNGAADSNGVTAKLDDIRHSISEEADTIARTAAQYGREAGSQVASVASDVAQQAAQIAEGTGARVADVAQDPVGALNRAVKWVGAAIAAMVAAVNVGGEQTRRDLTRDAKTLAEQAKRLRITTEPKKTGPDFMPGITLLAGFGSGVAVMYFLDPEQGPRRRALLRDQFSKVARMTRETVTETTRELSSRARAYSAGSGAVGQEVLVIDSIPPDTETQPWDTLSMEPAATDLGTGSSDPSTTDTWGEQSPTNQNASRIEIS